MARYYFDIINGQGPMRDDEGLELADADAVRATVSRIVTDLLKDEIAREQAVQITVNVRDESDFKVFSGALTFSSQWLD